MSGRRIALGLALTAALALAVGWWRSRPAPPTACVDGPVLARDARDRVVDGLAVDAGRIVPLGSEAEPRAWAATRGARVVELAGRALLPGFIDAHGHFPGVSR